MPYNSMPSAGQRESQECFCSPSPRLWLPVPRWHQFGYGEPRPTLLGVGIRLARYRQIKICGLEGDRADGLNPNCWYKR
jgi:hypothetical protein